MKKVTKTSLIQTAKKWFEMNDLIREEKKIGFKAWQRPFYESLLVPE